MRIAGGSKTLGSAVVDPSDGPGTETGDVPLDLSPATSRPEPARRRPAAVVALFLVLIAVVALLLRSLGDAALFFYEVSEAVERRTELADARFRVVGTPQPGFVEAEYGGESAVVFTLCAGGVLGDVVHVGDPAELFQAGVPVVLQGSWRAGATPGVAELSTPANDGWHMLTDHMVVKHDNDYRGQGSELAPCSLTSME